MTDSNSFRCGFRIELRRSIWPKYIANVQSLTPTPSVRRPLSGWKVLNRSLFRVSRTLIGAAGLSNPSHPMNQKHRPDEARGNLDCRWRNVCRQASTSPDCSRQRFLRTRFAHVLSAHHPRSQHPVTSRSNIGVSFRWPHRRQLRRNRQDHNAAPSPVLAEDWSRKHTRHA